MRRLALLLAAVLHIEPLHAADDGPIWLTAPYDGEWREMRACEEHVYRLQLHAGEVLRGFIEQDGVKTRLSLVRTDDDVELAAFNRNGTEGGFQRFLAIPERSGEYRLIVRTNEMPHVPRYRIHLDAPGPATDSDRAEVTAEALIDHGGAELLPQAAELCEQAGAEHCLADALEHLALSQFLAGKDLRVARDLLERAAAAKRRIGDDWGEASTLSNLGSVQIALGELLEARAIFERALPLRRTTATEVDSLILHNAAPVYWRLGEFQKAIDGERKVLEIWSRFHDRNGMAFAHSNLGLFAMQLGNADEALRHQTEAVRLWTDFGNDRGRAVGTMRVGMALEAQGKRLEALKRYREADAIAVSINEQVERPKILVRLGTILTSLGKNAEARAAFESALAIMRTANYDTSPALKGLGDLAASQGRYAEAARLYDETLDIANRNLDQSLLSEALLAVARMERDRGRIKEARTALEKATATVEALRLRLTNPDVRASYLASRQAFFELEIDVLMELAARSGRHSYVREAFEASERARARGLLDWLTIAGVRDHGLSDELVSRERVLRQRINGKAEALARQRPADRSGPTAKVLKADLTALLEEYGHIRSEIASAGGAQAGTSLSAARIQEQLDGDTLLLEYALGASRSFLWVVSRQKVTAFHLPPRKTIEKMARELAGGYAQSFRAGQAGKTAIAAARLGAIVLGPAASLLENKRLAIVADGALQYVSFAALPDPVSAGEPLIARHEVVMLPSASILAALRKPRSRMPTASLAVIADPIVAATDARLVGHEARAQMPADLLRSTTNFEGMELQRLPHTAVEAARIAAMVPAAERTRITGFEATREKVLGGELGIYRRLHFATHGLLNAEHPELSGLVLSLYREDGTPRDGFLRLTDVYTLRLAADLVVISACRTGLGRDVKREGLVGLTGGFMYAGAPRVVASLWDVRDSATAELMERFYRHMLVKRLPPAAALREAQLSMWKEPRWRSPFYWGAFTLQGDWK